MRKAPNERLSGLVAEARVSYESLARLICRVAAESGDDALRANKSSIAHWVAGMRPQRQTITYLTEALSRKLGRPLHPRELGFGDTDGVDPGDFFRAEPPAGDPVSAIASLGRADVDRRTLMARSAYSVAALMLPLQHLEMVQRARFVADSGTIVGRPEVRAVRVMTAAFNAADEQFGGGHARSAVVEYLATDVATLLRGTFSADEVRQEMFSVSAQLAYLAGWKAHDLGMAGLAQRYYLHSVQLAAESDPYAHAAYGLRILAHQAMDLGRHEHCMDLAEAALARVRGRVNPATECLFWLTAARAQAAGSARRKSLTALRIAERLIARERDERGPEWAELMGPAEARMANQAGKALQALGDLRGAEEQFRRSARCWNAATHPRIHGLTMAELADVQCAQGKVEQACETWTAALDSTAGVRSARVTAAVRAMRGRLAVYHRRGIPAVQRLVTYLGGASARTQAR